MKPHWSGVVPAIFTGVDDLPLESAILGINGRVAGMQRIVGLN